MHKKLYDYTLVCVYSAQNGVVPRVKCKFLGGTYKWIKHACKYWRNGKRLFLWNRDVFVQKALESKFE